MDRLQQLPLSRIQAATSKLLSQKKFKDLLTFVSTHPAEVFCLFAAIFGLLICFRMPPLTGTDEFTHFPRAYQIQSGKLWSDQLSSNSYGGALPDHIASMVNDYRDLSRQSPQDLSSTLPNLNQRYGNLEDVGSSTISVAFSTSAVYSPWSFFPPMIGLTLGKLLDVPLLWYIYFARISTLLIYILLGYLAIKIIPFGKWFMFTVALLPPSVVQAVTISPDSFVNGVSWVIIALTLALLVKKIKLTPKVLGSVILLALLLATIKQGYWLVSLFPLVIPAAYFVSKSRAILWKFVLVAGVMAATFLYVSYSSPIVKHIPARQDKATNYTAQVAYTVSHPVEVTWQILTEPLRRNNDIVLYETVGVFTNRTIYLPLLTMLLLYLALTLSLFQIPFQKSLLKFKSRLNISVSTIFLAFFVFISLVMYFTFSTVGSNVIDGLHGRYFIPLLPLLVAVAALYKKSFLKLSNTAIASIVIAITLYALINTYLALGK